MKLLVQFNEKNYVMKVESLKSVDELKSNMKTNLNNLPAQFDVQYYDEDFKTFVQLTSVDDIGNMAKLKVEKRCIAKKTNLEIAKRIKLSPSKSIKKSSALQLIENPNGLMKDKTFMNQMRTKIMKMIPPNGDGEEICRFIAKTLSAAKESYDKSSNHDIRVIYSKSDIVNEVAKKYPFLNSELGKSALNIVIQDASKTITQKRVNEDDLRRTKRKREDYTTNVKRRTIEDFSKILLAAGGLPNFLPDRKKGQTDAEIEKLKMYMNKQIKVEKPEFDKVSQALDHTLSDRRKYIVSGQHSITENHLCYPWLFTEKELIREFSRICNEDMNMKDNTFNYFNKVSYWVQKLLKDDGIKQIIRNLPNTKITNSDMKAGKELKFNISLIGIPSLLKEDICNLFVKQTENCSTNVSRISIHYSGDDPYKYEGSYELCIDGRHITLSSKRRALCACISAHYAFNIGYCEELFNFFTFMESEIFLLKTCQGAPNIVKEMVTNFRKEYASEKKK